MLLLPFSIFMPLHQPVCIVPTVVTPVRVLVSVLTNLTGQGRGPQPEPEPLHRNSIDLHFIIYRLLNFPYDPSFQHHHLSRQLILLG